jgi:L-aminopeptidase/D-esterase-like protein
MEKQNSSVFELSPLARRARAVEGNDTPLDGDTVFAAATGARALLDPIWTLASLGALAADVLARLIHDRVA